MSFEADFVFSSEDAQLPITKISAVEVNPEHLVIYGKNKQGEEDSWKRSLEELKEMKIHR